MAFQFKEFKVEDRRCAMKVGTDGVLLGTWAPVGEHVRTVLDAGAGCGVVSLLVAQRCPQAHITAVEVDADAAEDCRANIAASPWSGRMDVVCGDVTAYDPATDVDLLVSNPPFFTETLKAPDARRAAARHGGGLSPLTVVDLAARVASRGGRQPVRRLGLIGRLPEPTVTDALAIRAADNTWSPEYAALVSPFYLHMPQP